ncbi:MAG: thioredoxin [Firmicutes bacterium]|nr:thioredoxin [Bacillota bacterium]
MSEYVAEITDNNFEDEVIKADKPVVVDIWASWCGPCRMLAPIFEELAREMNDRVKFVKVDADKNKQTVQRYQVMSIPTLLFFKDGETVATQIGFLPKEQLQQKINDVFGLN